MIKQKRWRSEKYRKQVKQLPSVISGMSPCDCHHVIGHGHGGMGLKASDEWSFPLTHSEHMELHRIGWKRWEEIYGSQLEFARMTQAQLCDGFNVGEWLRGVA